LFYKKAAFDSDEEHEEHGAYDSDEELPELADDSDSDSDDEEMKMASKGKWKAASAAVESEMAPTVASAAVESEKASTMASAAVESEKAPTVALTAVESEKAPAVASTAAESEKAPTTMKLVSEKAVESDEDDLPPPLEDAYDSDSDKEEEVKKVPVTVKKAPVIVKKATEDDEVWEEGNNDMSLLDSLKPEVKGALAKILQVNPSAAHFLSKEMFGNPTYCKVTTPVERPSRKCCSNVGCTNSFLVSKKAGGAEQPTVTPGGKIVKIPGESGKHPQFQQ
jgi:hypothetical protein